MLKHSKHGVESIYSDSFLLE